MQGLKKQKFKNSKEKAYENAYALRDSACFQCLRRQIP